LIIDISLELIRFNAKSVAFTHTNTQNELQDCWFINWLPLATI